MSEVLELLRVPFSVLTAQSKSRKVGHELRLSGEAPAPAIFSPDNALPSCQMSKPKDNNPKTYC
jgi:hypothetical protein